MKTTCPVVVMFALVTGLSGCAYMRLNGCLKLAACGDLAAYADADGHTLRSEPVSTSHNPCHICSAGSR